MSEVMPPLKMSFGSFLEHSMASFEGIERGPNWRMPPFSGTHMFFLGDEVDFRGSLADISGDIRDEIRNQIPMPFGDICIVSLVRHMKTRTGEVVPISPMWLLHRIVEGKNAVLSTFPGCEDDGRSGQHLLISRLSVDDATGTDSVPLWWGVRYQGVKEDGNMVVAFAVHYAPLGVDMNSIVSQSNSILTGIAAISHPANYVVRVAPRLTSHEERRVAAGKRFPAQKTPHFIVVDHEVLVGMRRGGGTHASPVPHERRGHWRRLAERCRHAKLLGRDKVFVRPSFIGDPKFSDERNLYEVLEFSKEVANA